MDHLNRLEKEKPTIEDDEELKVFLGAKQLQRSTSVSTSAVKRESPKQVTFSAFQYQELRGQSPKVDTSLLIDSPPSTPMPQRPQPQSQPSLKRRPRSCGTESELTQKHPDSSQSDPTPAKIQIVKTETDNPCIDALKRYFEVRIPRRGQELTFVPSQYLNPITFHRPFFDEEEELFAEWGLPLTFHLLSFKTIIVMLSAILLERKVIVCCKNLRYLSALVLSLPPLLRPFLYQSVIIPMLPHNLPSLLDAPVPYVIGVTEVPTDATIPEDAVIIDVRKDRFRSTIPVPLLPGSRNLRKNCDSYLKKLQMAWKKEGIPYTTSKEQLTLVNNVTTTFENHLGSLFANFHNYTICNKTNPERPITVFMKDSFLADIEEEPTLEFIEPFLDTQTFFHYSDKRLRKRDKVTVRVEL